MSAKVQWNSTTETQSWQAKEASLITSAASSPSLRLDGRRFQTMMGFGGCFNELGWRALQWLPEQQRQIVMREMFDAEGCAFNMGRVPMGANDFALNWYSANETDGDFAMKHFSLERDHKAVIPFAKAAMQYQPGLEIFASPWSPPTWMKYPPVYNYGKLRWEKDVLEAYALYFVRFVQGYREAGLNVRQVHVQNEPDSNQKFPSCCWTGAELRDFIRDHLGPRFKAEGLDCEIWLGTIERADFDAWVNVALSDPAARAFISGVGFQWAGQGAVQRTYDSYPELPILQTESECGDGQNSWAHAHHVFGLIRHYIANGAAGYLYWNLLLQPGGESTWGWPQNSLYTVTPDGQLKRNPELFVMRHASSTVTAGSVRLGISGPLAGDALAFSRPDGATVILVANPLEQERTLELETPHGFVSAKLEPRSFNSLTISG
jgi:glucosylceramidase